MKPQAGAHWIITYDNPGPVKPEKSAPDHSANESKPGLDKQKPLLSAEYRVGSGMGSINKRFADGSSSEIYVVNGIAYLPESGTRKIRAEAVNATTGTDLRFIEVYPGCDWLKPEYLAGVDEQGNQRLLHFSRPSSSRKETGTDGENVAPTRDAGFASTEREAWIDPASSLPAGFRQGNLHGVYQFREPIDAAIPLPPEIEQAVKKYNGYR